MSVIEANIDIDLPDGTNPQAIIDMLRREINNMTGNDTKVNIIEVDDPVSFSPISLRKLKV